MHNLLAINPAEETEKICTFLQKTFAQQSINHAVIGLSGGIDSTVSLYLLKQVLPLQNIVVAHLYNETSVFTPIQKILQEMHFPEENITHLSINSLINDFSEKLHIEGSELLRLGNIASRIRMITLFDLAKKHNAMVVGTENKTEHLLGYYTRFGDQASDIEPIMHLYKTQIFALAEYLGIPQEIRTQTPTAGLWEGQTDEQDFGFTYKEADAVLYYHTEKHLTKEEIIAKGYEHTEQILAWMKRNAFKDKVPYNML